MTTQPRLTTSITAVGIAAVLMLSGCSFLPRIPVLNDGDGSSDNGSNGGDDVENNPFLDHDVPEGFPAEVPLPDLEIYFSLRSTEDSWSIIYKADDLAGAYNSIVAQFESAGFETLLNNSTTDGSLGVFKKDPYQVQVMGVADGSADFEGPAITFTVVRSS